MKKLILPFTVATGIAAVLSSCALDPNYREYKKQQAAATTANAASTDNPYGVPTNGIPPVYTPTATDTAPYQPLPGVSQQSTSSYIPSTPVTPSIGNLGSGSSYNVVPGDSLWAISKKHNTTVEAIQEANNLTSTTIRSGQNLIIPGR